MELGDRGSWGQQGRGVHSWGGGDNNNPQQPPAERPMLDSIARRLPAGRAAARGVRTPRTAPGSDAEWMRHLLGFTQGPRGPAAVQVLSGGLRGQAPVSAFKIDLKNDPCGRKMLQTSVPALM